MVFPVGFDEKFIVRALVRKREGVDGLEAGDRLLAIVPEGYQKEPRTVNAITAIKNIASPIIGEGNVLILEVPLNGEEIVRDISRAIKDNLTDDRLVLAVLSGGMRPLIVSTLLALLSIEDARIIVESDFENLTGHISLELGAFLAPAKRRWARILCGFLEGKSVRKIAEELGVSPATISHELREMTKYGLVRAEKPDGRTPKYKATSAGRLYLKIKGGRMS
ncbi:CRISPR-associated CARF protein Csa3 [Thermococcus celericrescens]|uniref:CRISPR-associated CARF protein Csa3 n=1 Tax=Thermococcus celericrescens TaxID=227598 RepID=UPI001FE03DBA|nr:CRISPR-associated CARF protein Csa3 [Thermococcus celericrescens]